MTVRTRLTLTFALVGVLLIGPTIFAARGLGDLRDLAIEGRSRHADVSLAVGRLQAGLADLDAALRSYVVTALPARRQATLQAIEALDVEAARIEAAGYLESAPALRASLADVTAEVMAIDSLVRTGRLEQATDRVEDFFEGAATGVRGRLQDVTTGVDLRAQADFERARTIGADALRTTLVAVAITIALALLVSAWTTRTLTQPLRQLQRALARVTAGELDAPPDLPYKRSDEIGKVAASFGVMSRRLAELDRLRAEFLGVASHELKTPINVIRGYTELIEEEIAGELTPQQREIMGRIGEQTHILARQVSRLMDISRLESGSFLIEAEEVTLVDLLLGVERAFEVVAKEKGIALTMEVAPDAPERLVVDIDLIRDEVLANLVSNALRFTPGGGQVTVSARGDGGDVVIEVADTGSGVPREHRPYIFEKYYQVERSRGTGSAGLGLAIAREMTEVHGGSLDLVDGVEPGARFRVTLPTSGERVQRMVPRRT